MRVIVDMMGGDKGAVETVKGVADAAARYQDAEFVMVGDREVIERLAIEQHIDLQRFDIVHTPVAITMEDDPLCVVRTKKDSSMSMGLHLLADGKGDAFVSTGNTGALFTGATLIVRKVRGIQRAAIGTELPTQEPCILLDTGANVTVTEEYLEQFAMMGAAYIRKMYGIPSPTVGLLNNGTEEHKGTPLQIAANERLKKCDSIQYVGNVEANAVLFGACHVVTTDGFTGNIFVKGMEGVGKLMLHAIKDVFLQNGWTKLSALMVKKSMSSMKKQFDPAEHGGSPFLGISRPVIKAHGSSDARAIRNAIRVAMDYAQSGVIYDIAMEAERFAARKKAEHEAAMAAQHEGE